MASLDSCRSVYTAWQSRRQAIFDLQPPHASLLAGFGQMLGRTILVNADGGFGNILAELLDETRTLYLVVRKREDGPITQPQTEETNEHPHRPRTSAPDLH